MRNIEEELEEYKIWTDFVRHDGYDLLNKHLDSKIAGYKCKIKILQDDPSLDNSFKITALYSRIDEIEMLVNKFKRSCTRKVELEKQISKGVKEYE